MKKPCKPVWRTTLIWVVPIVFLVYFFYQPLVAIFRLVFSPAFSAGWQTFDPKQISQPFFFTLYQAALSTLLTLVVGLPAALRGYGRSRRDLAQGRQVALGDDHQGLFSGERHAEFAGRKPEDRTQVHL